MIHLRDPYVDKSIVQLQFIKLLHNQNMICDIDSIEFNTEGKKFHGSFISNYVIDITQDKTYMILINYKNINYFVIGVKFVDKHLSGILTETNIKYEFIYDHLS